MDHAIPLPISTSSTTDSCEEAEQVGPETDLLPFKMQQQRSTLDEKKQADRQNKKQKKLALKWMWNKL